MNERDAVELRAAAEAAVQRSRGREELHPLDLRWWVTSCRVSLEHRCSPENPKTDGGCYGCLHNGFSLNLSGIKFVVDRHPERFQGVHIRGLLSPKPWDEGDAAWEPDHGPGSPPFDPSAPSSSAASTRTPTP